MRCTKNAGNFAATVTCLLTMTGSAAADPLLTRNQHPFVTLFGLPCPLPARLPTRGETSVSGMVNWATFAVTGRTDDGSYTLDGETVETRLQFDRALGNRLALHAELAWRQLGAGTLDSLVKRFHDVFGLPDGSRHRLPDDTLLLERVADGEPRYRLDQETSGIGDLPLSLGYPLVRADESAVSAWLTLKLPTGSPDDLTGSGATDVALSIAAERQLADHWQVFAQASIAWLGESDLRAFEQQEFAGSLLGGATWNAWRGLDLTVQVEANTAVFDTGTRLDGDALVLSFGGSYRTASGWRFDLGLSEDLAVDASPDVVLLFAVRHAL